MKKVFIMTIAALSASFLTQVVLADPPERGIANFYADAAIAPPGLQNVDNMPQGLVNQDKTPHGWTQGQKKGWHKKNLHSQRHYRHHRPVKQID